MTATRRLLTAASALVLVGSLAACSSDSSSTSTSTPTTSSATPTPSGTGGTEVCAAADQAKTSLQQLASLQVLQDGTTAIKAQLAVVQTDVNALVDAAKTDFAPQADAVKSAMTGLESSVQSLGDSPSAAAVAAVGAAVVPVVTAVGQLTTALGDRC